MCYDDPDTRARLLKLFAQGQPPADVAPPPASPNNNDEHESDTDDVSNTQQHTSPPATARQLTLDRFIKVKGGGTTGATPPPT